MYENNKIFVHLKWNSKYADKTNEEGAANILTDLSLTQNCKYFKNSYDWLLNRNEDRASSELDDPIQDENSPRNEKLIDTKFQSSLFGRVFSLSLFATLPLCSIIIPLVGRPDVIADCGWKRWMSGIELIDKFWWMAVNKNLFVFI